MLRAATVTSLFLLFAAPAMAHVVASPDTAKSGAWFKTDLRITHGCEGSDTTKITVTIPKDILIIKPQVKAGWKINVQKRTLDKPVQGPHGTITEVTEKISWTGELPDAYFDEFGLTMKLPETKETIYLPTLQECKKGNMDWKEIPQPEMTNMRHMHHGGGHDYPAPSIKITPNGK